MFALVDALVGTVYATAGGVMLANNLWLDMLCCPACQGALLIQDAFATAHDQHILSGSLVCQQCHDTYPIVRGVPRFIVAKQNDSVANTVEGFGFEWQKANSLVQASSLSDPELFLDFIQPVQPAFFQDKVVLDAGCGLGRDVLLAQRFPRRAFACLVKTVKVNGSLSAWVYGREHNGWIVRFLNPIRKNITSHMSRRLLWILSYMLALPLFITIRLVYMPVGDSRPLTFLRRFLFYFDYLCWLGEHCDYRAQALVIFDQLVPSIAEYISHQDFEQWFCENNLAQVKISSRAGNSWRGFGIKV